MGTPGTLDEFCTAISEVKLLYSYQRLTLFGVDVIVERKSRRIGVIDINYFPGKQLTVFWEYDRTMAVIALHEITFKPETIHTRLI